MRVPQSPAWQTWLLESPWLLAAAVLLGGAAAVWVGRRLDRKPVWVAGWCGVAAAFGLVGMASAVTTDREQVVRQTRALINATQAPFDAQGFGDLLTPDAVLSDDTGRPFLRRGAWLLAFDSGIRRAGVESHFVQKLVAGAADGRGVVELDLVTRTHAAGPTLHKTQWTLVWAQTPAGYRLKELRCLGYNGQSPAEMLAFLRSGGGF